jgi:predicted phosphodiesterase
MMNILHLTDLHIANPNGTNEALRKGYYKEYIYDLKKSFVDKQIDMIFVTGDIVDCCNVDNYEHAANVLRYLAKTLSVPLDKVFICNGNHDVNRDTGSRLEFDEFSESLSEGKNKVFSSDYYSGYKINNDLVLTIDSINKNYAEGYPSTTIVESIVDGLVSEVEKQKVENLFILSHHATYVGEMATLATIDEGDNWSKDHIWLAGDLIFRRVAREPNISGKAFWFAGDVHMPQHLVIDDRRIISTTGSLNFIGGDVKGTTMPPSVRLMNSNKIDRSSQFEYKRHNHKGTGCEGKWNEVHVSAIKRQLSDDSSGTISQNNITPNTGTYNPSNSYVTNSNHEDQKNNLLIWNAEFDTKLKDNVNRNKLYRFGQFSKGGELTSLSWISITQLFQDPSIYGEVVKSFRDAIKCKSSTFGIEKQDCLIVGIDNWGAILSARLGAATNIRSCGIGVKGGNESYDDAEIVNSSLTSIIKSKKLVFVVSDILATGNTIKNVYRDLSLDEVVRKVSLSVFVDLSRNYIHLPFFDNNVVLCGSIKIPVIETRQIF